MCVQETEFFLSPPSGLGHVEFLGAPEDARHWFVGSADIKNAFHQMRAPGLLQAFFFCTSRRSRIRSWSHGKNDRPETFILSPQHFQWGFLGGFFCGDVTDHCPLAGSADSPLSVCRDHSTPPPAANMAWDPLASVGRMLTNWEGVSHVSLQVYSKARLDVHGISLASGSADVFGYEVSPAHTYYSGTGKRTSRIRSVARTVSSPPSHWRIGDGARQWSRVFLGAHQSWGSHSLLPASNSRGRLSWFQESHGPLCVWPA